MLRAVPQVGVALKLLKYAVDFVDAVCVLAGEPAWPAHLPRTAVWRNRVGAECVTLAIAQGLQPAQLERLVCCVCENLAVEPHAFRSCAHCCCKSCIKDLQQYVLPSSASSTASAYALTFTFTFTFMFHSNGAHT